MSDTNARKGTTVILTAYLHGRDVSIHEHVLCG